MDTWKSRGGKSHGGEDKRWRKSEERRCARKGRKVAIHGVSPTQEGRKVGSLKRRVRSQLARWEMKNCTPLWREASTFGSKQAKNTSRSEHFWKLTSRKSARRCGAKHIFMSKRAKHTILLGPLLKVEMSNKCTPLWCEACFQVKMYQTRLLRTTFGSWDVWKSARRCGTKHLFKYGQLLDIQMAKKCTLLWHEAHLEGKSVKN